jgi:glycosyltransferase involved in cell wall biosynthesis
MDILKKNSIEISIIIPVYGCKDCLVELHRQLTETLQPFFSNYEILFIDDCSKDYAWDLISDLAKKDPHIKGVKFSRNFGQHAAITAGLAECSGNYAIVMDCDLQDPPQEIPYLYQKAREGYDIVFAKRQMKKHSFFRRITSSFFFKIMNKTNEQVTPFDSAIGGFSIISRKVIKSFLKFSDRDRQYIFILRWLGFKTTFVEYEHAPRYCGTSSYNFMSLLRFSLVGICSQTTILLNIIIGLGFFISFIGFGCAIYFIISYFFHGAPAGWTSLITTIFIMSGIIVSSIGIVGLYIGKIFEQVKCRPLYVIDEQTKHSIINSEEKQIGCKAPN